MANAIILHRRRRAEVVVPGSQTFTSNGTFVAPYSAEYTVRITGSRAKCGNGGNGGRSTGWNEKINYRYGGQAWTGGGGGSGGTSTAPGAHEYKVHLSRNESVTISCTTSMVSFGSYASCGTGSNGENGGAGTSGSGSTGGIYGSPGQGGEAGTPGTNPVYSCSDGVVDMTITSITAGVSGHAGNDGKWESMNVGGSCSPSVSGGSAVTTAGRSSGRGGGASIDVSVDTDDFMTTWDARSYSSSGGSGGTGAAAVTGSITISWGGNT